MSAKTLQGMKRQITQILRDAGNYDPTLCYQVELVATDILIYRKMREELLEAGEILTQETSREGDARRRANPLVSLVRKQSEIVQKGLDRLTMNIASKPGREIAKNNLAKFYEAFMDEQ